MITEPVRWDELPFAATLILTLPFPLPTPPLRIVIHEAELLVLQVHDAAVETSMLRTSPDERTDAPPPPRVKPQTGTAANPAFRELGEFIANVTGLELLFTAPVQVENWKPALALPVACTKDPSLKYPSAEDGESRTVPPPDGLPVVVSRYCVRKFAV
jgi:hypothetical protein